MLLFWELETAGEFTKKMFPFITWEFGQHSNRDWSFNVMSGKPRSANLYLRTTNTYCIQACVANRIRRLWLMVGIGNLRKVAKDNTPSESIVQASCWNRNTLAGPLLCCSDPFKVKAMRKNQYCVSGSAS